MTRPQYSIGIDLGTTNSALAFVPLDGDAPAEILAIPQLASPVAIVEAPTLPSFLYLPEAADAGWEIGRFARGKAVEAPGRVVHSAKSWLCHHSADRSAPFLPWGSDDVGLDHKISPVRASALILSHLRDAWNDRFAAADAAFDAQVITITVPASFDAVAQRLTVAAALEARFPESIHLLEEPQAALYRWLDLHEADAEPRHVVVVDIGGGTSDFSLFAFRTDDARTDARVRRIAVSDHLLLGGDNMDLALAHRLEPQLIGDGDLSARQWSYLVAQCRDLKEAALSGDASADDRYSVSIPGRGARLIAEATSAQVTRAQIEALLLEGFFPECAADEYPIRTKEALRELGLPYARDPAVTRHLADFLRGRPAVDAVLFNGGSLSAQRLRQRICTQIGTWQSGPAPVLLVNDELDRAVAYGAARFGKLVHTRAERIAAGLAHAIFLQAQRTTAAEAALDRAPALVCVLPKGAPTEQMFAIADLGLALRINASVRFQAYSSARDDAQRSGDIVAWNDRDFHPLPPLETSVDVPVAGGIAGRNGLGGTAIKQTLPVDVTARLSDLGRLEIVCVSTDRAIQGSWPLEFNLRGEPAHEATASPLTVIGKAKDLGLTTAPEAARSRIETLFTRPIDNRDKLTATRLIKSLEVILGAPKSSWNVGLVRSLWTSLERCMTDRARSADHEEAWLILAGFLLRPGFGAAMDDARIDRLWTIRETGLYFSATTVKIQAYVLWRRVAGGLDAERQETLLTPALVTLREDRGPLPELVLLAGALERISVERKTELIERFIDAAMTLEQKHKHNAHFLAALGSLLNRAPLYAGPELVVSADLVQRAFEAFSHFDWDGSRRVELQTLFLRAARVVDNRSIEVSRSLRNRIAEKLEKSGVDSAKTAPLRNYLPLQRSERAGSFGDSLPPGLLLTSMTAG